MVGGILTLYLHSGWHEHTHALSHKKPFCVEQSQSVVHRVGTASRHIEGFNPSHSSDWMISSSLIKSYITLRGQADKPGVDLRHLEIGKTHQIFNSLLKKTSDVTNCTIISYYSCSNTWKYN